METAYEDATQHYPQIGRRPELNTHDGTEDGPRAGNVEELNEEHLPLGHGLIVHPVSLCVSWRLPFWFNPKHALHQFTINEIAQQQGHQRNRK